MTTVSPFLMASESSTPGIGLTCDDDYDDYDDYYLLLL
jgi:hypothetical protein